MNPTLATTHRSVAPPVPIRKFPIKVICVLRDLAEQQEDHVKTMREFCHVRNVMFECRVYNSYQYKHDRDEIVKLPAFHAYLSGQHDRTFYPIGRPLQHVEEIIALHLEQMKERQDRKHKFRAFLARIIARLKTLTERKKTRLELEERRRQAEEVAAAERRRSMSLGERHRTHSMIDWD